MTQHLDKKYQKQLPISPPSQNIFKLHQLILNDPILIKFFQNSYNFNKNYQSHQFWQVVHQLMLDGVRYQNVLTYNHNKGNRKLERNVKDQCCCGNFVKQEEQGVKKYYNKEQDIVDKQQKQKIIQLSNNRKTNKSPYSNHNSNSKQKNSQTKHYNVSYIKHNRFLSPSQRKQYITPKITETIPVKQNNLVIYGKPRVIIDDNIGCPYHNSQQECLKSIPYSGPCEPKTARQRQIHILQKNPYPKQDVGKKNSKINQQKPEQNNTLSRYKSSPNLNQMQMMKKQQFKQTLQNTNNNTLLSKTKKNNQNKINYHKNNNQSQQRRSQYDQTVYVDKIIKVQTRVPGKMRVVQSPKNNKVVGQSFNHNLKVQQANQSQQIQYLNSKYTNLDKRYKNPQQAQSKIKFMIERDKKNKAMQKNMKKQQQRIKILQNIIYNEQKDEKLNKHNKQTKNKVPQSKKHIIQIDSSNSDMSMMDSKILDDYRKRNRNHNSNSINAHGYDYGNDQKEKGSAHFMLSSSSEENDDQSDSISCSKTLNQYQNIENIRIRKIQKESEGDQSYSQFNY